MAADNTDGADGKGRISEAREHEFFVAADNTDGADGKGRISEARGDEFFASTDDKDDADGEGRISEARGDEFIASTDDKDDADGERAHQRSKRGRVHCEKNHSSDRSQAKLIDSSQEGWEAMLSLPAHDEVFGVSRVKAELCGPASAWCTIHCWEWSEEKSLREKLSLPLSGRVALTAGTAGKWAGAAVKSSSVQLPSSD